MEESIGRKDAERIRIVEASTFGKRMLDKTAKSVATKLLYVRGALLFKEFYVKELDDIVREYQRDAEVNLFKAFEKWEQIFDDFCLWLGRKGIKGRTATTYFQGAKNLINANVPKSSGIQVEAPKARSRTIPPVTIEDLRKIRKTADAREGAFIDLLKDSGIARDDAIEMTYGQVKKAVEDPTAQYLPIRMYRKKENVEYVTWIGINAIESLRIYFDMRERRGETITDETPIFASHKAPYERLNKRSLSEILRRLGERYGVELSTHRLRKFFETYIAAGGIHPATAKFWMGHTVGSDIESRYIISPENLQREMYEKAYPYIDTRETKESEDLLVAEIKARLESLPPHARRRFADELKVIYPERAARFLEKDEIQKLLKAQITDGGLAAFQSQRLVSEEELPNLLAQGWRVAAVLPSGKIVVSNEK